MQNTMKLSQLAEIIGGKCLSEDTSFTNVNTDTRRIQAGDLFFALKGENFDAHDFITQAREQGAAAAVVNRAIQDPLPQLLVKDTHQAFGAFAKWHRNQYSPVVLGVTGSNGKT